jgi:hypothetical protein
MVTPQTHPIVGKIRDGLALSLHAQAWADAADEAARQGKERLYPPQAQILDYCGQPTAQANYMAAKIIGHLETLNRESIILTLQRASQADGFEIGSYTQRHKSLRVRFRCQSVILV